MISSIVLIVYLTSAFGAENIDPQVGQRLQQVREKWLTPSVLGNNQEVIVTEHRQIKRANGVVIISDSESISRVFSGNCYSYQVKSYDRQGKIHPNELSYIEASNARYSFRLKIKPDGKYLLRYFILDDDGTKFSPRGEPVSKHARNFLLASESLYSYRFGEFFFGGVVDILDQTCIRGDELHLHFQVRENQEIIKTLVVSGIAKFSNVDCRIMELDLVTKDLFGQGTERIEYQYDNLGRLATRLTNTKTGKGTLARTEETFRWSDPLLQENDFTLSAYGLPEPQGVNWEKPTPRYVWWLLLAGGCLLLALICRIIALRVQPKRPM